jgi:hypothetical protein
MTDFEPLPQPDRTILDLYYGLGDGRRHRHEEIATRLGFSRHRVRFSLTQSLLQLLGPDALEADGVIVAACVICGTPLAVSRATDHSGRGKVCSTVCLRVLQRRSSLVPNHPMRTAVARLRAKDTLARRDPELRAHRLERLREACRRRDKGAATVLAALPAEVWTALPERDADIIRRYYGLVDEQPATASEVAMRHGLSLTQVRRSLATGVALLLGEERFRAHQPRTDRRRGREASEQLKPLVDDAFLVLPERSRAITRLYYGLDQEWRCTQQELGDQFSLSRRRVKQLLDERVALLLGVAACPEGSTVFVPCAICGGTIEMRRWRQRPGCAHTCSTACLRELLRRNARARHQDPRLRAA